MVLSFKKLSKKVAYFPTWLAYRTAQHSTEGTDRVILQRGECTFSTILHLGNINRLATLNVETINGSDGSANCFRQVASTEYGQHLFRLSFEKLWVEHLLQKAENCTSSHLPQYICLMNGFAEFSDVALRWTHSVLNLWSLGLYSYRLMSFYVPFKNCLTTLSEEYGALPSTPLPRDKILWLPAASEYCSVLLALELKGQKGELKGSVLRC